MPLHFKSDTMHRNPLRVDSKNDKTQNQIHFSFTLATASVILKNNIKNIFYTSYYSKSIPLKTKAHRILFGFNVFTFR